MWADPQLSEEMPALRARGESQYLEYMQSFPESIRDLAKEIAAFSTSNAGTILIGVADSGDLIGLKGLETAERRDEMLRRIEGICQGPIKPSITPTVKFVLEADKVVLVLMIPKGNQPVYYSSNIPYIRHITQSRPAEPHEVIDLVRTFLEKEAGSNKDAQTSPQDILLSRIARILSTILIYTDEIEQRCLNPWLDQLRGEYRQAASELRDLATSDVSLQMKIDGDLCGLADALDEAGTLHLYIGCEGELSDAINKVAALAESLKKNRIDPVPLDEDAQQQIKNLIITSSRNLHGLYMRSDKMIDSNRFEELRSDASGIGYDLLRVCFYNISSIVGNMQASLKAVARNLHLIETTHIYMDGGASLRATTNNIMECDKQLSEIAQKVQIKEEESGNES